MPYPARLLRTLPLVLLSAATAFAHDIITTKLTYSREISRIFAARCLACHGTTDSIPLTTYEQVRPWAVSVKEQVLTRAMPPSGAVKGFGDIARDAALSQEEISIVAAWVLGGAPEGDPATLPKPVVASHGQAATPLQDALAINPPTTLHQPLELAGIRPLGDHAIQSARITATLPDGRIVPLLWLYQYDARLNRTFVFRRPISLSAGTVIAATEPVRLQLARP